MVLFRVGRPDQDFCHFYFASKEWVTTTEYQRAPSMEKQLQGQNVFTLNFGRLRICCWLLEQWKEDGWWLWCRFLCLSPECVLQWANKLSWSRNSEVRLYFCLIKGNCVRILPFLTICVGWGVHLFFCNKANMPSLNSGVHKHTLTPAQIHLQLLVVGLTTARCKNLKHIL